jgi:hypothetical protein
MTEQMAGRGYMQSDSLRKLSFIALMVLMAMASAGALDGRL